MTTPPIPALFPQYCDPHLSRAGNPSSRGSFKTPGPGAGRSSPTTPPCSRTMATTTSRPSSTSSGLTSTSSRSRSIRTSPRPRGGRPRRAGRAYLFHQAAALIPTNCDAYLGVPGIGHPTPQSTPTEHTTLPSTCTTHSTRTAQSAARLREDCCSLPGAELMRKMFLAHWVAGRAANCLAVHLCFTDEEKCHPPHRSPS